MGSLAETLKTNKAKDLEANSTKKSGIFNLGPLLDDGVLYSAIGEEELQLLKHELDLPEDCDLDPIPLTFHGFTHWQYWVCEHSSAPFPILGFLALRDCTDFWSYSELHPPVLPRLSQCVIGKKVTKYADIEGAKKNTL